MKLRLFTMLPTLLLMSFGIFFALATTRGDNLPGEEVILEQLSAGSDGAFRELATLTTNPGGTFRLSGVEPSKSTDYRARFAGDAPDGLQASKASTLVKVKR